MKKSKRKLLSIIIKLGVIPLTIELVSLYYLLKPGFSAFIDNGAVAPNTKEFLNILQSPWGFWFVPGMILPYFIYLIIGDRSLAWKLSILIYQYLTFLIAFLSITKLAKIIGHYNISKVFYDNRSHNLIIYLVSLIYGFNIYAIGGFANYYLWQFQMPQIFLPLYIVSIIEFFYFLSNNREASIKTVIKKATKIVPIGFFVQASPPALMMSITFIFIMGIIAKILYKISSIRIVMPIAYIIALSNLLAIIDIFLLGIRDPSIERYMRGDVYLHPFPLIHVLTLSYPDHKVNQWDLILLKDFVIPSSLVYYIPITLLAYMFLVFINKVSCTNFSKISLLSIMINIILVIPFVHGFGDDILGYIIKSLKLILPSFIYSAYYNHIVDIQHLFAFYAIFISTFIFCLDSKKHSKYFNLVILAIIIQLALSLYYFIYIQHYFYAEAVRPVEVPITYSELFNYILNHNDKNFLWIPSYGTPTWRGSFVSDIPGFLAMYFNIDLNCVQRNWVFYLIVLARSDNCEDYRNILANISKTFAEKKYIDKELLNKANINYIIIDRNILFKSSPNDIVNRFEDQVIKNRIFKNILSINNVRIYEVAID